MKEVVISTLEGIKHAFLYFILAILFIEVLFFIGIAHAEGEEKYCPTIMAIYGVCSPELVLNYLAHAQDRPPVRIVAKPPGTASNLLNNSSIENITNQVQVPVTPGALKQVFPCWCAVDDSRRCRNESGEIYQNKTFDQSCKDRRDRLLGQKTDAEKQDDSIRERITRGLIS